MSVHYAVDDAVATITMDSPHNRNALSSELMAGLREHLARAAADQRVRVVVLAHTGTVFCSGMDLRESSRNDAGSMPVHQLPALLEDLWTLPKPVIARVGGAVRAGGLGLLAACDLAVAVPAATFAFAEVRRGLVPAMLVAHVLPLLPPLAGRELFLTGAVFDATRAAVVGLINAVADDPDAVVAGFAEDFRLCGPGALATTKRLVRGDFPGERLAELQQVSARQFASAEGREGMAAFAEKRPPAWVSSPR